ncbi:SDR family NAD(P)-dependent oxidoreductase [Microbacterium sp. RD1]|uniref:SDR family NAD(P)-dependent oxidoreductase n=1 Tax=Microbacterium sp. RD1 TaxID=3457313 RepID=UPI003FA54985
MPRFSRKVALVTGAAGGIGASVAIRFAREGGTVVVADVNLVKADEVADEVRTGGGTATAWALDVSSEASWRRAVAETVDLYGRLDALVNCAAVADGRTIDTTSFERYRDVVAVTQGGVFLGMHVAGPELKAAGGGSVVNVGSMFGLVGGFGTGPAYHAAKGAVRTLTKNVALAWAADGVRVNAVHPGFIDTPLLGTMDREVLTRSTPLGRLGTPDDVAALILFLISDEAAFITGSDMTVDGGYTAR